MAAELSLLRLDDSDVRGTGTDKAVVEMLIGVFYESYHKNHPAVKQLLGAGCEALLSANEYVPTPPW